jgi:metallo-beta-lactamase family protein
VRIHGKKVLIRAEVVPTQTLSARADVDEIMQWLRWIRQPPRHAYVLHGEPNTSDVLRRRISVEQGGGAVSVPKYRDSVELTL